jgi:hypothetical protein
MLILEKVLFEIDVFVVGEEDVIDVAIIVEVAVVINVRIDKIEYIYINLFPNDLKYIII